MTKKRTGKSGSSDESGAQSRPAASKNSRRSPAKGAAASGAKRGKQPAPFPVVGIGASAGGLEAFVELLRNLPDDTGMAFVFIQHYKAGQPSMLAEILRRETIMPVADAVTGMELQPNRVYVLASYGSLSLSDNVMSVAAPPARVERHMPIDQFFHVLAEQRGSRAIGVVLSGTASDGTLGLKAIKAAGGITFVQDEESARYDGMPRSAIVAGAATMIAPPKEIAKELVRIARHPYVLEAEPEAPESALESIFSRLLRRYGVDFTHYKRSTINRRLRRRMVVHHMDQVSDYASYLDDHPAELDELYHDMLINVTAFFRDPEVFESLKQHVLPALVKRRQADNPIRVWVPGCATGEEVYSIAIAFIEYLEEVGAPKLPLQFFATDIDERAIAQARAGVYPESIAEQVPKAQLQRYFVSVGRGYQILKSIRELCVFSAHNVVKDPPFSRLDLISCRNLLIYLGPVLQKTVLPIFHFALKPGGYLVLGTAESVGDTGALFEMVDKKAKIYSKKAVDAPVHFDLRPAGDAMSAPRAPEIVHPTERHDQMDVRQAATDVLTREFSPAAVVIDEQMRIVEFRGHTGRYLEPAPGEASLDLLKMAREGLVPELRAAVVHVLEHGTRVHREHLRADPDEAQRTIGLDVVPLRADAGAVKYVLVVFREYPQAVPLLAEGPPSEEVEQEVEALRQELAATKEYLHSIIEQQEASNEELRCANEEVQSGYEELQSTNEELQSTNEELETAKEELQSSNEELRTVNDELESRNNELHTVNNDLSNLVSSIDTAIVMVGPDLRIRRFTPRAQELLNLIDTDIGRPIGNIKPNLEAVDLEQAVQQTIKKIQVSENELRNTEGHWYAMRVHPYVTSDSRIDGAVIAFTDVDRLKSALDATHVALEYAERIIAAVKYPLLVLDQDLRVVNVNQAYLDVFHATEKDTEGNLVHHLGEGQWAIPALRQRLQAAVETGEGFEGFEVEHEFKDLGQRRLVISAWLASPGLAGSGPRLLMQVEQSPPPPTSVSAAPSRRGNDCAIANRGRTLRAAVGRRAAPAPGGGGTASRRGR